MQFFIDYWYVILALIVLLVFIGAFIYRFFKMPSKEQIKALQEWLKYAVCYAEQKLKSGTGQLKLRKVYDMALTKFPWITTIYSFAEFEKDVDVALEWMKKQLSDNKNIEQLIKEENEL